MDYAQINAGSRVKLQGAIGDNPSTTQGSQACGQARRKRGLKPSFAYFVVLVFLHLYLCADLSG